MREQLEFDVVIVGGGVAGLSAACKLMQLAEIQKKALTVCVIEKGSQIGAHILSGAIMDIRALDELFPDWQKRGAPITTKVNSESVFYLNNEHRAWKIPSIFLPNNMSHEGGYLVKQGKLCQWLSTQAQQLGVEVITGFAANQIIFNTQNEVCGVITGDIGVNKKGEKKSNYMPGIELRGKYILFAEGSRGHLGKQLIQHYKLDCNSGAQHFSLGLKEIWKIHPEYHQEGKVIHHFGWPLGNNAQGGGFFYFMDDFQVALGLVVDLNYSNIYLSPFDELQRMKHHPIIASHLKGGRRLSYGARCLTKGGYYALPKMTFPGGILIGCEAGLLNSRKLQGIHTAMKSGILAANRVYLALKDEKSTGKDLLSFADDINNSWLYNELYSSKNNSAAIHRFGYWVGSIFNYIDQTIFRGKLPIRIKDEFSDHTQFLPLNECIAINYPKPDNQLSFDKTSSIYLSNVYHEYDQPCHLKLKQSATPFIDSSSIYAEQAIRYCPAGVYNISVNNKEQVLNIEAQNCLHCKACDIKASEQSIIWTPPEGGGGPEYKNM